MHLRQLLLLLVSSTALAASGDIEGFLLTDAAGSHVLTQPNMRSRRLGLDHAQLRLQFKLGGVAVDVEVHKMQQNAFTDELKITTNGITKTGVHVDVPTFRSKDRSTLLHFNYDGTVDALVTRKGLGRSLHVRSSSDGRSLESIDIPNDFLVGVTAHNNIIKTAPHTIHRKLAVNSWVGEGKCYTGDNVQKKLKIGIAMDSKLYEKIGNTEEAATTYVNGIVSKANAFYGPQLGIVLFVDALALQTPDAANKPEPDWDTGRDIEARLKRLSQWEAPSVQASWQLIGDIDFTAGTAGLASMGTVCQVKKINYATPAYGNRGVNWHSKSTWATFAHELGHNFGASHSWEDGQGSTGGIMDYGGLEEKKIDKSWQFNTKYRKAQICAVIQKNMVDNECGGNPDLFAAYKPVCGNGIIEEGETCECDDDQTTCACCEDCLISAGKMCTPTSDGCCTSDCMWSDHGKECGIFGGQGYCAKGVCTDNGEVCPSTFSGGICQLDGCTHACLSSSGECNDVSRYSVGDGGGNMISAGKIKDGTYCETTDCFVGTCDDGQCKKDPNAAEHCAASPDISLVNSNTGAVDISEYHPSNLPSSVPPFATSGCASFSGRFWDQDSDLDGGYHTNLGLKDCYKRCVDNGQCHSFDYENDDMTSKENGKCVLFSSAVSSSALAYGPQSQVIAYVCQYLADSGVVQTCDKLTGTGIKGDADIIGLDGLQSVDSCYVHCQDTLECQWFTYNTEDGSCSFYSFMFSSQDVETNFGSENTYQCKLGGADNVCVCENGVAATGASCPQDGWGMCVTCEDGATKEIYTEGSKAGHVYCEVPPAGCVSDNSFNGESCDVAFGNGWSCGALENWNADCTGCYNCAKTGGGGAGNGKTDGGFNYFCDKGVEIDSLGCCDGECPFPSNGCKCYSQGYSTMTYTLGGERFQEKTCSCSNCRDCEVPDVSVDGEYGGWSKCSEDCGGGIQTRSCDSPAPSGGGAGCTGEASQTCSTQACAVDPPTVILGSPCDALPMREGKKEKKDKKNKKKCEACQQLDCSEGSKKIKRKCSKKVKKCKKQKFLA